MYRLIKQLLCAIDAENASEQFVHTFTFFAYCINLEQTMKLNLLPLIGRRNLWAQRI